MRNLLAWSERAPHLKSLFGPWPGPGAWWTLTSCPVKELPVSGAAVGLQRKLRSDILHRLSWKLNTATCSRTAGGRRGKVFARSLEWREDEWGKTGKSSRWGDNEVVYRRSAFDFTRMSSCRFIFKVQSWRLWSMQMLTQISSFYRNMSEEDGRFHLVNTKQIFI